jgi:hypothetical protein
MPEDASEREDRSMPDETIRPFTVTPISDDARSDLKRRVGAVRWPSRELVTDRSQGVPLATMQALADHWANAALADAVAAVRGETCT